MAFEVIRQMTVDDIRKPTSDGCRRWISSSLMEDPGRRHLKKKILDAHRVSDRTAS